MVKIRVMCMPADVEPTMESIRKVFNVISASSPYPCRQSKCVRLYLEVQPKEGVMGDNKQ